MQSESHQRAAASDPDPSQQAQKSTATWEQNWTSPPQTAATQLIRQSPRAALPEYAEITKEAICCMQECVSELISFVTSEAAEEASREARRDVDGDDIPRAMMSLWFDNYSEALKIYQARYRESLLAPNRDGSPSQPQISEAQALSDKLVCEGAVGAAQAPEPTPAHDFAPFSESPRES